MIGIRTAKKPINMRTNNIISIFMNCNGIWWNMKKILNAFLFTLTAGSILYGNNNSTQMLDNMSQRCPNNIYFGPDFFVFDLNTHFKDVRAKGTKFFLGLRLGYEF